MSLFPESRSARIAVPLPVSASLFFLATVSTILPAAPTVTDLATWTSTATGTEIPRQAMLPDGASPGDTFATVIYLENLGAPRVGRDSDEDIINSFLDEGMLVVTMDYAGHAKARVPFLNQDIVNIRQDISDDQVDGTATRFPTSYAMDNNHIFIVPEGCRLMRDLVFQTVSSTSWSMDIIYPADPLIPVGTLIEFSFDNNNRMNSSNLAAFHDSIISAEASEGFATVMADHPVVGSYNGIDPMPESALSVRAAVRAVRAQSDALGLNGRIATMGFSRGSGVALMAVTTKDVQDWRVYLTLTSYLTLTDADLRTSRDAYPDEDPSVQGAIIMSGRFTYVDLLPNDPHLDLYTSQWGPIETNYDRWLYQGALDFLQSDPGYPLFLTINNDDEHAFHQMDVIQQRLTNLGASYIYREDTVEPLAHRVTLVPSILNDMNRYLRSVLMDPNPESLVINSHLAATLLPGNKIRWTADAIFPPADYGVSTSSSLADWSISQTVRPKEDGSLSVDLDVPADTPLFLQIASPADPQD